MENKELKYIVKVIDPITEEVIRVFDKIFDDMLEATNFALNKENEFINLDGDYGFSIEEISKQFDKKENFDDKEVQKLSIAERKEYLFNKIGIKKLQLLNEQSKHINDKLQMELDNSEI